MMTTSEDNNTKTSVHQRIVADGYIQDIIDRGYAIYSHDEEMIGNILFLVVRYGIPDASEINQKLDIYSIGPRGGIRRERHI